MEKTQKSFLDKAALVLKFCNYAITLYKIIQFALPYINDLL